MSGLMLGCQLDPVVGGGPLGGGDADGVEGLLAHVAAVAPQAVPLQRVNDPQETHGVLAGLAWQR